MEYLFYKLLHLLALVVFLGNIFTGFYWMHIAMKTKNLNIINHSFKGVIQSEKYFTIPTIVIITLTGIWVAILGRYPILKTQWILWPLILFSTSGLVFVIFVNPLQKTMQKMTSGAESQFDWQKFNKMYLQWKILGVIAFVLPLIAFILKVLKLPF